MDDEESNRKREAIRAVYQYLKTQSYGEIENVKQEIGKITKQTYESFQNDALDLRELHKLIKRVSNPQYDDGQGVRSVIGIPIGFHVDPPKKKRNKYSSLAEDGQPMETMQLENDSYFLNNDTFTTEDRLEQYVLASELDNTDPRLRVLLEYWCPVLFEPGELTELFKMFYNKTTNEEIFNVVLGEINSDMQYFSESEIDDQFSLDSDDDTGSSSTPENADSKLKTIMQEKIGNSLDDLTGHFAISHTPHPRDFDKEIEDLMAEKERLEDVYIQMEKTAAPADLPNLIQRIETIERDLDNKLIQKADADEVEDARIKNASGPYGFSETSKYRSIKDFGDKPSPEFWNEEDPSYRKPHNWDDDEVWQPKTGKQVFEGKVIEFNKKILNLGQKLDAKFKFVVNLPELDTEMSKYQFVGRNKTAYQKQRYDPFDDMEAEELLQNLKEVVKIKIALDDVRNHVISLDFVMKILEKLFSEWKFKVDTKKVLIETNMMKSKALNLVDSSFYDEAETDFHVVSIMREIRDLCDKSENDYPLKKIPDDESYADWENELRYQNPNVADLQVVSNIPTSTSGTPFWNRGMSSGTLRARLYVYWDPNDIQFMYAQCFDILKRLNAEQANFLKSQTIPSLKQRFNQGDLNERIKLMTLKSGRKFYRDRWWEKFNTRRKKRRQKFQSPPPSPQEMLSNSFDTPILTDMFTFVMINGIFAEVITDWQDDRFTDLELAFVRHFKAVAEQFGMKDLIANIGPDLTDLGRFKDWCYALYRNLLEDVESDIQPNMKMRRFKLLTWLDKAGVNPNVILQGDDNMASYMENLVIWGGMLSTYFKVVGEDRARFCGELLLKFYKCKGTNTFEGNKLNFLESLKFYDNLIADLKQGVMKSATPEKGKYLFNNIARRRNTRNIILIRCFNDWYKEEMEKMGGINNTYEYMNFMAKVTILATAGYHEGSPFDSILTVLLEQKLRGVDLYSGRVLQIQTRSKSYWMNCRPTIGRIEILFCQAFTVDGDKICFFDGPESEDVDKLYSGDSVQIFTPYSESTYIKGGKIFGRKIDTKTITKKIVYESFRNESRMFTETKNIKTNPVGPSERLKRLETLQGLEGETFDPASRYMKHQSNEEFKLSDAENVLALGSRPIGLSCIGWYLSKLASVNCIGGEWFVCFSNPYGWSDNKNKVPFGKFSNIQDHQNKIMELIREVSKIKGSVFISRTGNLVYVKENDMKTIDNKRKGKYNTKEKVMVNRPVITEDGTEKNIWINALVLYYDIQAKQYTVQLESKREVSDAVVAIKDDNIKKNLGWIKNRSGRWNMVKKFNYCYSLTDFYKILYNFEQMLDDEGDSKLLKHISTSVFKRIPAKARTKLKKKLNNEETIGIEYVSYLSNIFGPDKPKEGELKSKLLKEWMQAAKTITKKTKRKGKIVGTVEKTIDAAPLDYELYVALVFLVSEATDLNLGRFKRGNLKNERFKSRRDTLRRHEKRFGLLLAFGYKFASSNWSGIETLLENLKGRVQQNKRIQVDTGKFYNCFKSGRLVSLLNNKSLRKNDVLLSHLRGIVSYLMERITYKTVRTKKSSKTVREAIIEPDDDFDEILDELQQENKKLQKKILRGMKKFYDERSTIIDNEAKKGFSGTARFSGDSDGDSDTIKAQAEAKKQELKKDLEAKYAWLKQVNNLVTYFRNSFKMKSGQSPYKSLYKDERAIKNMRKKIQKLIDYDGMIFGEFQEILNSILMVLNFPSQELRNGDPVEIQTLDNLEDVLQSYVEQNVVRAYILNPLVKLKIIQGKLSAEQMLYFKDMFEYNKNNILALLGEMRALVRRTNVFRPMSENTDISGLRFEFQLKPPHWFDVLVTNLRDAVEQMYLGGSSSTDTPKYQIQEKIQKLEEDTSSNNTSDMITKFLNYVVTVKHSKKKILLNVFVNNKEVLETDKVKMPVELFAEYADDTLMLYDQKYKAAMSWIRKSNEDPDSADEIFGSSSQQESIPVPEVVVQSKSIRQQEAKLLFEIRALVTESYSKVNEQQEKSLEFEIKELWRKFEKLWSNVIEVDLKRELEYIKTQLSNRRLSENPVLLQTKKQILEAILEKSENSANLFEEYKDVVNVEIQLRRNDLLRTMSHPQLFDLARQLVNKIDVKYSLLSSKFKYRVKFGLALTRLEVRKQELASSSEALPGPSSDDEERDKKEYEELMEEYEERMDALISQRGKTPFDVDKDVKMLIAKEDPEDTFSGYISWKGRIPDINIRKRIARKRLMAANNASRQDTSESSSSDSGSDDDNGDSDSEMYDAYGEISTIDDEARRAEEARLAEEARKRQRDAVLDDTDSEDDDAGFYEKIDKNHLEALKTKARLAENAMAVDTDSEDDDAEFYLKLKKELTRKKSRMVKYCELTSAKVLSLDIRGHYSLLLRQKALKMILNAHRNFSGNYLDFRILVDLFVDKVKQMFFETESLVEFHNHVNSVFVPNGLKLLGTDRDDLTLFDEFKFWVDQISNGKIAFYEDLGVLSQSDQQIANQNRSGSFFDNSTGLEQVTGIVMSSSVMAPVPLLAGPDRLIQVILSFLDRDRDIFQDKETKEWKLMRAKRTNVNVQRVLGAPDAFVSDMKKLNKKISAIVKKVRLSFRIQAEKFNGQRVDDILAKVVILCLQQNDATVIRGVVDRLRLLTSNYESMYDIIRRLMETQAP